MFMLAGSSNLHQFLLPLHKLKMAEGYTEVKSRAEHLFHLADREEKGFVTKRDMLRIQSDIGLDNDQMEIVFDSLDADRSGYLTFDEFICGFGVYLEEPNETTTTEPDGEKGEGEENENFMNFLDNLGGDQVFQDEHAMRQLLDHFRSEDPTGGAQFERFLANMSLHKKGQENNP